MDRRKLHFILYLVIIPVALGLWSDDVKRPDDAFQRWEDKLHYQHKRQMGPPSKSRAGGLIGSPRRLSHVREPKRKPTGHLAPLEDDEMENEDVVSVAIHPPPIRKSDKLYRKTLRESFRERPTDGTRHNTQSEILIKNVITNLAREFMFRQVDDNFIFGQFVGNSMKNLTADLKTKLQHDILDLIVIYQKSRLGSEGKRPNDYSKPVIMSANSTIKLNAKREQLQEPAETKQADDVLDFANLDHIVR